MSPTWLRSVLRRLKHCFLHSFSPCCTKCMATLYISTNSVALNRALASDRCDPPANTSPVSMVLVCACGGARARRLAILRRRAQREWLISTMDERVSELSKRIWLRYSAEMVIRARPHHLPDAPLSAAPPPPPPSPPVPSLLLSGRVVAPKFCSCLPTPANTKVRVSAHNEKRHDTRAAQTDRQRGAG